MEKKKVLHIVESFGSGVFSFLVDLINNTDEEFEVTVAYGVRSETLNDFRDYFNDKVQFIEVKNFTRSINPIKDLKALIEIKKIIRNVKPDVIHLHSSKAGFLGRFAANGRKIKMLYNPHGFSFLMQNSSKLKRKIYYFIEKIAALRKCTIVGCSKGEYEEALKLTKNAININNGIDINNLDAIVKNSNKRELDVNNLKICTIGRIGFQKNPELFNQIAESFPDIQFTWIGDGDLRNKLVSKNITITGWLKREEVLKEVANNDIFILTSLWEGLPISLLEAMYLQKICIVTNFIGNSDVIENNKNGFVCNDINEFINNIEQLLNHNIDYTNFLFNAKEDVVNDYNTKIMSDKYIKVYNGQEI